MAEEEHQSSASDFDEKDDGEEDEDEEMDSESEDNSSNKKTNGKNPDGSKSSSMKKINKRKRRKARGQRLGQRRNIKSKYDTVEDLNPEALSAHNEEVERLRRLELQQSLTNVSTTASVPKTEPAESAREIFMVDLTCDDDDDEDTEQCRRDQIEDTISLEDESSSDSPPVKKVRVQNKKNGSLASKYDIINDREDNRILVNVNHPSDEEEIFLAPQITRTIKSHQIGGVRFMFDNVIESINRYHLSVGFGCILADAMGLGKTLQVISFIDVFLRNTSSKRVVIVVPVNTIQNWQSEFNRWLPSSGGGEGDSEVRPRNFSIFMLNETVRSMEARYEIISQWYKLGGVLLIGYEMYRLLSLSVPSIGGNKMATKKRKKKKKNGTSTGTSDATVIDLDETEKEMDILIEIQTCLCDPGPELIVCDEGHRIKNDSTNISQALKKIKTKRRIVLTGYPLQNNLLEYWCMVDFVRPKYLGTKQEFLDLFERPITNGQCIDSTPDDVRKMKYRSHVLHRFLAGFVLRRGHEILHSVLPPKFEYVILVRNSPIQEVLYDLNMLQTQEQQKSGTIASIGPLKAFAVCSKIWNHPDIYYEQAMQQQYQSALTLLGDQGLLGGSSSAPESSTCKLEWPSSLHGYETRVIENSPKMAIMMSILELSVAYGDRILIFSQSLSTLSLIEKFLNIRTMPLPYSADIEGNYKMSDNKWIKGQNYFRLDGSTNSSERDRLICQFNSPSNYSCWAFLLSTKAGCLGINLIGANRVIVVDVSWNPCFDSQAVCRVYRYGQTKPSYIYRLVSDGSMEKRMYDRQISKQGMADRVVDELNPERHFTASDILSLLAPLGDLPPPTDMAEHVKDYLFDSVLMQILTHYGPWLTKLPFKHESLLIDSQQDRLTEVEKYVAMKGFHQQLKVMRNQYMEQNRNHTQLNQPHPQQNHPSHSSVQPTLQPHPQMINQQQFVQQLRPQLSRPIINQSLLPQSDQYQHSQTHSMSSVQNHPAVWYNNNQQPLQQSGTVQPQYTNNVNPLWRGVETGGSSQVSSRKDDEVICIDSDSDNEGTTNGSLGVASVNHTPFSTAQHTPQMSLVNPPHVSSTSIPVAMVTPNIISHTNSPSNVNQSQGHTPSEAAVTSALAGFVQFQKNMCKDLSNNTDVIGPAKLAINSLANTLTVLNNNNEHSTPAINNNTRHMSPTVNTSSVQLPVGPVGDIGCEVPEAAAETLSDLMTLLEDTNQPS